MTRLILYSTPSCGQCRFTKRVLEQKGIDYTEVDLTQNDDALKYVTRELGYSQVPVVVADDHDHWAGFQPDQINRFAKESR